jgi:alcohol dehydrogenase class IV
VKPEPFEAAVGAAKAADAGIGFGGGSTMDLVKFVAALVTSDRRLPRISGPNRAPKHRVALAQIPTTAGSGSTWRFALTECRATT